MNDGADQRRLSAILAADVVGYTRLMEQDTDGTVAAWKSARSDIIDPTITKFSGRIVKHTGDGFLAEFQTVQAAVECAVALQNDLTSGVLEFRMGVNLGDIVDDGEDIHGEGVNIAARIEALAETGGICISGGVYDQVHNQLDHPYEDMGEVEVKHVSDPVRVYRLLLDGQVPVKSAGNALPMRLAIAAMVAVIVGGGAWWWQMGQTTFDVVRPIGTAQVSQDKPSIAVLPFANMSEDKGQDYFVDGMTEDIITDLSKVSGLMVIARNSSFTYKGKSVKVQDVGRDLGVKYVLEGSARRAGNRVRINAQLVSTEDGSHLWAERYDRDLTDVFALQDEVTRNIVQALAVTLTGVEQSRRKNTREASPDAYDSLLRGLVQLRRFTPETNALARKFFEQAAALDPSYARAHANVAFAYVNEIIVGWVTDREETLKLAQHHVSKAMALDSTVRQVHLTQSVIYMWKHEHESAVASAQTAISVAPNYADAYAQLASVLSYSHKSDNNPEKALQAIRTAKRLNPHYSFFYLQQEGRAHFQLRQYELAARLFEQIVERNPHFLLGRLYLAASYAHSGRSDDADWEIQEVLTLSPEINLAFERERAPYQDPADLSHFIDGLRMAGLPES